MGHREHGLGITEKLCEIIAIAMRGDQHLV